MADDGGLIGKAFRRLQKATTVEADNAGTAIVIPDSRDRGPKGFTPESEEAMREQGMSTGDAFAPGSPLAPWFPQGTPPRQWDYPTGFNIQQRPRIQERITFDVLKAIVEAYDVARLCIEKRMDEIRVLDWHLEAMDGIEDDVKDQIDLGQKFFRKPDGNLPFDAWQQMVLEDVLRYDAGCLYRRRNNKGDIIGLEVIDGTTMAPLLDYYGHTPQAPAPAYVQWIKGVPMGEFSIEDVIYQPFRPQPDSPYGLPPIEWLLITINTDIRYQWHFLNYFTEGTVPDTWMEAPPDQSSPEQLIAWTELWESVMRGQQQRKHQVRWIPSGSTPHQAKETKFDVNFPEFLLKKTCAAYGVQPAEIGFTQHTNRATASQQQDTQERRGTVTLANYLAGMYSRLLQDDMGLPLKFVFETTFQKEDILAQANADKVYVSIGAVSPDDVAEQLGHELPEGQEPAPRVIIAGDTVLPVNRLAEIADAQANALISGAQMAAQGGAQDGGQDGESDIGGVPTEGEGGASTGGRKPGNADGAIPANTRGEDDGGSPGMEKRAFTPDNVLAELARWKSNTKSRMKKGQTPRRFSSDCLPAVVEAQVWKSLEVAEAPEDVDAAFAQPFYW